MDHEQNDVTGDDQGLTTAAGSFTNYKILGHNTSDNGTTYGVLGAVDSGSGYGLYTPDDARVDGTVETTGQWQVDIDGTPALRLGAQSSGDAGAVVHGYAGNDVLDGAVGGTVGGGGSAGSSINNKPNRVYDHYGTVGGGENNRAGSDDDDPGSATHATVTGGKNNEATGEGTSVGGGVGNVASDREATVAGGQNNGATGPRAAVAGGVNNAASGSQSAVLGGNDNTAGAPRTTVGGGEGNEATAEFATVGGGQRNRARATAATIAGGGDFDQKNFVYDDYGTIGGGLGNVSGTDDGDPTTQVAATVGGGEANAAGGKWATVGGGNRNAASGTASTIAGGRKNDVVGDRGTVGGGKFNVTAARNATVGGGIRNSASGQSATIGGGRQNGAGTGATVGGGAYNAARGAYTTIAGGGGDLQNPNVVYDDLGTIGGGRANTAGSSTSGTTATAATVAGGEANAATATAATVPGGKRNEATGKYSLAAGRRADTNGKTGALVWGDGTDQSATAQADGEVRLQASGGFVLTKTQTVEIRDGLPAGTGNEVGINSSNELVDRTASSARYKTNIDSLEVDRDAVLDLEPRSFEYERTGESGVGLVAEDVAEKVPALVVRDEDGRPDGVRYDRLGVYLLPELQAQRRRIASLESKIEQLCDQNDALRTRIAAIEDRSGATPPAGPDIRDN